MTLRLRAARCLIVSIKTARAALSYSAFTGISRNHLDRLVEELAAPYAAAREARLYRRRGNQQRRRCPGAGHPPTLTFRDRLLCTLVWLRLGLSHQCLAILYGVDRSTVSAAIRQIRPLLANRGFTTPTGVRLHTLADVFAYAAAEGLTMRLDGTEIQVRRPRPNRPGRRAFVSGKKKQNTIKTTLASDGRGRPVWAGAIRPGRMHDQTAVKTEGIDALIPGVPRGEDPGRLRLPRTGPRPPRPGHRTALQTEQERATRTGRPLPASP